jgi:predicted nucleic acid-binding protein
MRYVGDASALLTFVIADERGDRSDALLARLGSDPVCVPVIWHTEVLNGLIQARRRGRLDARGVDHGIAFFEALHVQVDSVRPEMTAVRKLADAHKLSAYDATYLELAVRESIPLATNDAALAKAARVHGVKTL